MKKAGIITIYDENNYGNRLQNYAVQSVVKSLGFSTETIINATYCDDRYFNDLKSLIRYGKQMIKSLPILRNYSHNMQVIYWNQLMRKFTQDEQRRKAFKEFNKNIKFYKKTISCYSMHQLNKEFDYFITGSDQVWNCKIGRGTGIDFLAFASKKKRIAYAASISLDEIPPKYNRRYKAYLHGMKRISVREKIAEELIKKDFGCNAIQVIDPTMMIHQEEWKSLADQSKIKVPENYIICMFLGEDDEELTNNIKDFAKKNNMSVLTLNDKSYEEYYKYGPLDFLNVIRSANFVFTDSFHGCVFSILFHRNFYAVRRKGEADNMYSRIRGLLHTFSLEDRQYENAVSITEIEYKRFDDIEKVLKIEREKTVTYLKEALK